MTIQRQSREPLSAPNRQKLSGRYQKCGFPFLRLKFNATAGDRIMVGHFSHPVQSFVGDQDLM